MVNKCSPSERELEDGGMMIFFNIIFFHFAWPPSKESGKVGENGDTRLEADTKS